VVANRGYTLLIMSTKIWSAIKKLQASKQLTLMFVSLTVVPVMIALGKHWAN
jgi:hypothetical protein